MLTLPLDLYGVVPEQQRGAVLPDKLQRLEVAARDKKERERLQSTDVLSTVLNHHCILPPLNGCDQELNSKGKHGSLRGKKVNQIQARTILRGAVMDALVTAAGGQESILASSGAYDLLISPWVYFRISPGDSEEFLANSIMKSSNETIPAFTGALTSLFSSKPTLLPSLDEHANLIKEKVLSHHTPTKPGSKQPQQKKVSTAKRPKDCSPTSVQAIRPTNEPLSLLPIVSILRESCNQARALPPADRDLWKVLNGQSLTNPRVYPPEQTDPIRGDNAYTRLLLKIIPPAKLTTAMGASALLAYMGTGQCTETGGFLLSHPTIFWEYEHCISAFEAAKASNDLLYSSHPMIRRAIAEGKKPQKFISGMTRYEYPQVWGQPCCHLSVQDGIRERFQPIFDSTIQEKWKEWLGPSLGKDPALLTSAEKHSWKDAIDFVQGLGIKGFTSGLTSLQFANNLWVAGIVGDPSAFDMASWLYVNRDLGAARGLKHLGLQPETFKDFYAAFLVIHGHLDEHLSMEDKEILHFSVIFVEHLLCKISRWGARLQSQGKLHSKVGGGPWAKGTNRTNNFAFPAPEIVCTERLEIAVGVANGCPLN